MPPVRELVRRCCVPLADAKVHPQTFYGGLRLVAIDGSCFELPDEAEKPNWDRMPRVSANS